MPEELNAKLDIRIVNGRMVLYLSPSDWETAVMLNRYYLLKEEGAEFNLAGMAPVVDEELDGPLGLMMLSLKPVDDDSKKLLEEIKDRPIPKDPRS